MGHRYEKSDFNIRSLYGGFDGNFLYLDSSNRASTLYNDDTVSSGFPIQTGGLATGPATFIRSTRLRSLSPHFRPCRSGYADGEQAANRVITALPVGLTTPRPQKSTRVHH